MSIADRPKSNPLVLAGAAMELGVGTAVLTWAGSWLDGKFDTGSTWMIVGLAVGLIGGTYNVWRMSKKFF